MAETDAPQLYLVTPRRFELSAFAPRMAAVLDAREVACVRLRLDAPSDAIARAADGLRDMCHARDVAFVIEDHWKLVGPHGLDGVHLSDPRGLRDVRKELGKDAIAGTFCGTSRHAGMTAGEIGADYVSFGPVTSDPMLGNGELAGAELFEWWSQMIEVPVVAEGGLTVEMVGTLTAFADFLAVGDEIWSADDPVAELRALLG